MRALAGLCLIAGVNLGVAAIAQTTAASDAVPVPTLHVSSTLVETPMLILKRDGSLPQRPPSGDSIEIQLGNGGWFRPNYVRQEGADPIDLAILLDLNSRVSDLSRPLSQALSS